VPKAERGLVAAQSERGGFGYEFDVEEAECYRA
jgi:hypothetical protein